MAGPRPGAAQAARSPPAPRRRSGARIAASSYRALRELLLLGPAFRRYRWRYLAGALCIVGAVLLRLLVPRYLGDAIDLLRQAASLGPGVAAEPEALRPLLVRAVLWILGVAAAGGVVRTTSRLLVLGTSRRGIHDLRRRVFAHLLRLPPSFYAARPTGDVMSRVVNDVQFVQSLLGPVFLYLAENAALYVVCLSFMLGIDPVLTGLGLLPFPFALWRARRIAAEVQRLSRASQEGLAEISARVDESLSGQMVVKGLALEDFDYARFERRCREYRDLNLRLTRTRARMQALMIGLAALGPLVVLLAGGPRVVAGGISLGDFVAMLLYLQFLAGPTAVLGFVLSSLQRGRAALGRLGELLATEPALADPPAPAPLPPGGGALAVRGLTIELENERGEPRRVLDGVSFELPAGRSLGVVGATGAGKSVLLRALARQLEIPPGTVFLDGADLTSLRLADARGAIGYVPQEAFLFSASLAENVALGRPEAGEEEIAAAVAAAGLAKDLPQFPEGLATLVGERGLNVSGGQRQRVALARVLLLRPRLLLLDDPFSAVDAETTEEILAALAPLMRGRTTVLVAHRVATVRRCDEILVLDRGRVVERGSHAELLAAGGRYARLEARQRARAELAAGLEEGGEDEER
ncbi:MAG: ABC transporter ATP-binding protein [Planctomycetota bacterium]|nr:MAG: ABC transporter ATP-binding protein [Planctomycetota bacterium]